MSTESENQQAEAPESQETTQTPPPLPAAPQAGVAADLTPPNALQERALAGQEREAGTSPQSVIDMVNARAGITDQSAATAPEGQPPADPAAEPEKGAPEAPQVEPRVEDQYGYGAHHHRRD